MLVDSCRRGCRAGWLFGGVLGRMLGGNGIPWLVKPVSPSAFAYSFPWPLTRLSFPCMPQLALSHTRYNSWSGWHKPLGRGTIVWLSVQHRVEDPAASLHARRLTASAHIIPHSLAKTAAHLALGKSHFGFFLLLGGDRPQK